MTGPNFKFLSLALLVSLLLITPLGIQNSFGVPAEGTLLASFNAAHTAWSATFDGTNLYVPLRTGTLISAYQTDGTPLPGLNINAGVTLAGAISWDPVRQVFWTGSTTGGVHSVYTVTKTGLTTFQFNVATDLANNGNCGIGSCSSIIDGLDYDPFTDSIWYSPDGAEINYNFDANGNLLGTMPINVPPNNMIPECGDDFTSGIMGRGTTVYVVHHLCGVFKYDISTNPPTKLSFFPVQHQIEDAECDARTFRNQGVDALWIGSSGTLVDAYAVPVGTCASANVGGEIMPLESTSLLLAGVQTSLVWIFPMVLVGAGFTAYKFSKKLV